MNVEFSEPEYGLVLHVDGQIIRLVGGMPYLDLFAYKLCGAFVEYAFDGDRRVVLDMSVKGYLEGGIKLLFG